MSSRPVTAWSLASPWGSAPRSVLRGLGSQGSGEGLVASREAFVGPSVVAAIETAAQRWGAGRIGSILATTSVDGGREPWPCDHVAGPAYVLSTLSSPGHLLHSGLALLQCDLVDAVLVATTDTIVPSSLLIERHGEADARLWCAARPRPDAVFRLGPLPAADRSEVPLPKAGGDVLAAVTLALACLRGGLDPRGMDAEPDRIGIVGPRTDAFTVEVTP